MVTAAEICARVETADRARIQTRADAAARVAADVERRKVTLAELAEIEAAIATGVSESAAVMTLRELAEFTGIPQRELRVAGRGAGDGSARRSTRRKPAATSPRARKDASPPTTAPPDVATADQSD